MRAITFIAMTVILTSLGLSVLVEAELVFHYDFESEELRDASGKNNLGEIRGEPQQVEGMIGKGLKLNGVSDQIFCAEIVTGKPLTFMNSAFTEKTVTVWIKADDVNGNHSIFEEGGSGNGFGIKIKAKKLEFAVTNANAIAAVSADYDDTDDWHHVAAVYNKGELRLYIDGEEVANGKADFQQAGSHVNGASIGCTIFNDVWGGGEGSFFQGIIDEFRYYNNALSTEEIGIIYHRAMAVGPCGKSTSTWGLIKYHNILSAHQD